MTDTLSKNWQGRYSLSDGTYFTTGDDIEVKLDYNHWIKTEVKHNRKDYYLKDYPQLQMEGLIARKP
ncbi:DUF5348 domain-containing protein [Robertmurraya korlensis]|uniref:DUF5348 domain-containing protein n=1 Tax=Robertmurraya korlensis TaxID=519977 RepID=UPI00203E2478|nr:DUF5348 domain-containing protein [Robertmurraya korlensis]MCM3603220.1 DUF5348 domain-containing protein [Robertmurraya korlensis]